MNKLRINDFLTFSPTGSEGVDTASTLVTTNPSAAVAQIFANTILSNVVFSPKQIFRRSVMFYAIAHPSGAGSVVLCVCPMNFDNMIS